MSRGGYWNDRPRGFLAELVRRKVAQNVTEEHAWRFVNAMQWGGLTTNEAWDVIRVHDCLRFGHSVQVQRIDELPDRWFRDAWTRQGSNTGLIRVDLEKARPIQWARLSGAVKAENKRRAIDLFGKAPIKLNKGEYQSAIKNARDTEELRRCWHPAL
jgi:hypothetical protein